MHFKWILLVLVMISFEIKAQEEQIVREVLEALMNDLPEDFDYSEWTEQLNELRKFPIDINKADVQNFKKLFFLSVDKASSLISYRETYGNFIDVLELQAVPGFDEKLVQLLIPFVTVRSRTEIDKISFKNLVKLGNNDLVLRLGRSLQTPKGYVTTSENSYLGGPERAMIRYKYQFADRLNFSFISEKDAGEKMNSFPSDFISASLALNKTGPIKRIVVGDYSLQFGQGLTLWSGFGFGKSGDVTSLAKKDEGLKPYASANEYSFFRGISAAVGFSKFFELTGFWSNRSFDASINNGELGSINETGYHRTPNEIANRNSVRNLMYGLNISYTNKLLQLGGTFYKSKYDRSFNNGSQVYRRFHFSGQDLINAGFNYSYTIRNFYVFGEVSKNWDGGLALINAALISFAKEVSGVILYRNYAKNYHNFYNSAIAEADGFNESGLYVGININPSKQWQIALYLDYFKFPWLKFRIDAPSEGQEYLAQISFNPSKKLKALLRYKAEVKGQNTDQVVPINYVVPVEKENIRLDVDWKMKRTFGFQNRIEIVRYGKEIISGNLGFMAVQDISFKPQAARLSGNVRLAYFKTQDFNSRIYAYEDDMLYNFGFSAYHGNGWRSYLNLKYKLAKKFDLWARYSIFRYRNLTSIGTGLDEIQGNKKSDFKVQLRVQF